LEPQWQVLGAYARAVSAHNADWPTSPELFWRAAWRLYVASAIYGYIAALGSIDVLIKHHSDPDDQVSMVFKLTMQKQLSALRATADTRRLIFRLLVEGAPNTSLRSEERLIEISERAASHVDRLGALLVLERYGSVYLTAESTERILRGNMGGLSAAQRLLVYALFERFCRRWSDTAILRLFKAGDAISTQLAGRCLSPSRGVLRGRPRVIRAAIAVIRSRPIDIRTKWLKIAQEGLGGRIPVEMLGLVIEDKTPSNHDIATVASLYA
jgi:hypothetical protein